MDNGMLNKSSGIKATTFVPVGLETGTIPMVAAGFAHTIGLRYDGTAWAWGNNSHGQLGDGTIVARHIPVLVQNLANLITITAGSSHTVGLRNDGTVWTWGSNNNGQLGDGTTINRHTPIQVQDIKNVIAIAASGHTIALREDGTVWTWGPNFGGQLGDGTTIHRNTPVQVQNITNVISVAASTGHSIALRSNGTVWAWGNNWAGQLGDGTTTDRYVPIQVQNLTNVVAIAVGQSHNIALREDGTVWTWGWNRLGQLGDGTIYDHHTPVQVQELTNVTVIAAGSNHSTALMQDGTTWIWGNNINGQLGDGTTIDHHIPMQVQGLTNVIDISGGSSHTVMLREDGSVWSWGANWIGQLGDGYTTDRHTPIQVLGPGVNGFLNLFKTKESIRNIKINVTTPITNAIPSTTAAGTGDFTLGAVTWSPGNNPFSANTNYTATVTLTANEGYTFDGLENATINNNLATITSNTGNTVTLSFEFPATVLWDIPGITPMVAAGNLHTAGLRYDGTVWAWGRNSEGQLGDGTNNDSHVSIQVQNLTNVSTIALANHHSLALKGDGTVWAWGYNTNGQLGDGTSISRHTPVQVLNLTNITAIAASREHSVALKKDGTVWVWGGNWNGQLGDIPVTNSYTPIQVQNLTNITNIAAGSIHNTVLRTDGTVWAWGSNGNGQLGNGTTIASNTPVQVLNLTNVVNIAAGNGYNIALRADGTVWAWGFNGQGQLGDGATTIRRTTPVQVLNLTNITAIATVYNHIIALREDGTVWTWGRNFSNQLGDGSNLINRNIPIQVLNLTNVAAIAAGFEHTLALKTDGSVWAWGANNQGQLGDGTIINRRAPVQTLGPGVRGFLNLFRTERLITEVAIDITAPVIGEIPNTIAIGEGNFTLSDVTWSPDSSRFSVNTRYTATVTLTATGGYTFEELETATINGYPATIVSNTGDTLTISFEFPLTALPITPMVSAGSIHTVGLKYDGTVWAWGSNEHGLLGDGSKINRNTPIQVQDLSDVASVSAGGGYTITLRTDGTVWGLGWNSNGQLGDGTTTYSRIPVQAQNLTNVISIAASIKHTAALKADGTVWTWGLNNQGWLGDGTTERNLIPIQVNDLTDITAIAAGDMHTVALREDGTVWAWGDNGNAQLGDGTVHTRHYTPIQVHGLTNVTAVAAGHVHTIALREDGTVWAWGANSDGRLGDGTTTRRNTPVQVQNLTNVIAIAANGDYNIALRADGIIWAWGANGAGQLGDGTLIDRHTPVQVHHIIDAIGISAGNFHSAALREDGIVWTWGSNVNGQLGDGTDIDRFAPIRVLGSEGQGFLNLLGGTLSSDITTVAINVTAPVTGAIPNTIATGTGNFTRGNVSWSPGSVPFSSNTRYTATVTLTANDGFSFDGLSVATINGNRATISNNTGRTVTLSFEFPLTIKPQIPDLAPAVAAGSMHSVALRYDGTVWAWGRNHLGELGEGTRIDRLTPVQVQGLTDVIDVVAGAAQTVALREDGTVWAWGHGGSLANGTTIGRSLPVQMYNLANITAIAAGREHTIALRADGTVWAWGWNGYGQVGDGTTTTQPMPVQVQGITNIIAIAAGGNHTLALRADGTVWTWGWNSLGQLGSGNIDFRSLPTQVPNLTNVTAIAAGLDHSIALRSDRTVLAWGANEAGQLGDGTTTSRHEPRQVQGLTNVTAIAGGTCHTITLRENGTVWGFGSNRAGQLGDGTIIDRHLPIQVSNFPNVIAIATGQRHTVALRGDGYVWTWGYNMFGQLGNNTDINNHRPTRVLDLRNPPFLNLKRQGLIPITNVAIDVTPPVIGETQSPVATGVGHFTRGPVTWSPEEAPFGVNTRYTATVTLTANAGHTFNGLTVATINGNTARVTNNTGNAVTLSFEFPRTVTTEPTAIPVALVNVIAPIGGAIPSQIATVVGSFTPGTVTWSPSASTFVVGTRYTATVTLTANPGHTFNGLTVATINGNPARVTNNTGNAVTLSFEFLPTVAREISVIPIAAVNVVAPVVGAAPNVTATGRGNFTLGAVAWSPNTGTFIAGTRYAATVGLTANEGYTFEGLTFGTVNGNLGTVSNNTGNGITVSFEFLTSN